MVSFSGELDRALGWHRLSGRCGESGGKIGELAEEKFPAGCPAIHDGRFIGVVGDAIVISDFHTLSPVGTGLCSRPLIPSITL